MIGAALVASRRALADTRAFEHDAIEPDLAEIARHLEAENAGADHYGIGGEIAFQPGKGRPLDIQPVGQSVGLERMAGHCLRSRC